MLKVNRDTNILTQLPTQSLPDAGWKEREDLQQMIRNSPNEFFDEMGEELYLIGEEVTPTDFVEDRIDLLAVDQQGSLVVLELKRKANKFQLLQAIAYAAMVAKWDPGQVINAAAEFSGKSDDEATNQLEAFMTEQIEELNLSQRLILIAEGFDYEVMVAAEWLTEKYNMDVRCYRLKLSRDNDTEYLSCTRAFPPAEITEHSIRRGRRRVGNSGKWSNWEAALAAVDNKSIVDFFNTELEQQRDNNVNKRQLIFRINRKRVWGVHARADYCYVWQDGRFENDLQIWKEKLSKGSDVAPVRNKSCLRFYLRTKDDFEEFKNVAKSDLKGLNYVTEHETLGE